MRLILVIAAFVAGCLYQSHFPAKNPSQVKFEGVAWCLYGQYASLKAYDQTTNVAPHSMVDVHSRGVTVWVRCEKTETYLN